jgi:hypothetical protein
MEIRFSDRWAASNDYPEDTVRRAVQASGTHARVKWADDSACRFTIVEHRDSYRLADSETHDKVIRALLAYDPGAEIRTARAIYRGLIDYQRQNP